MGWVGGKLSPTGEEEAEPVFLRQELLPGVGPSGARGREGTRHKREAGRGWIEGL